MRPVAAEAGVRLDSPLVLVATNTLTLPQQAAVEAACAAVGARPLFWRPGDQTTRDGWPSLMVAGLPSGARRLPAIVSEIARDPLARLPIVLLCEESLQRPSMASHGGHIVLLDPTCSSELLAGRLRMLLAGAGRWRGDAHHTAEQQREGYWLGVYRGGEGSARPGVENHGVLGLTILLSVNAARVVPALLDRVTAALAQPMARNEQEQALSGLLGAEFAMIHLSRTGREWRLYFPWLDGLFFLYSPARLPHKWDFNAPGARPAFLTLPSGEGDLLVATTAGLPEGTLLIPEHGGPALLDALSRSAAASAHVPVSGAVVEVS